MKLFTAILLLAPAFFMAEGVYLASGGMAVLFASVIVLCSLACLAWGCWIFRRHRKLACLCISSAVLYLIVLALLLLPPKAPPANQSVERTGGSRFPQSACAAQGRLPPVAHAWRYTKEV